MASKKQPIVTKQPDLGAPAALKAIAEHELRCRIEKDTAYATWQELRSKLVEDDEVSERIYRKAHREYQDALEVWHDASKKLLEYDKVVAPERRDGEKVSVDEVKEYFRQYTLTIDLQIEQYIIQIAQAASLCESSEQFHIAHAEAIRSAKQNAVDAAFRDGVIPKWICDL